MDRIEGLTPEQSLRLHLLHHVGGSSCTAYNREIVAEAVLAYERLVMDGKPLPFTPSGPTPPSSPPPDTPRTA